MAHLLQAADGGVAAYPYTMADLQRDHPGTVFFLPVPEEDLVAFGVVSVVPTEAPQATLGTNVEEAQPELIDGRWTQAWVASAATEQEIAARKQRLVDDVDNAVAAIYLRVGRFADEHKEREAAALEYQAAGYVGQVPRSVAAFANPAGVTPTYAANLILAQAAQLRGALATLGELRMRKYELKAASAEVAYALHAQIIAAVHTVGASL